MKLEISKIDKAAQRLRHVIHWTKLESSETLSKMCGGQVFLKYENQQKTGSFKIRGAYNKIATLLEEGSLPSVVASSAGNHAQGVAFAACQAGIPATIVMPRSTPIAKISATESYGANVVIHGDCYDDAYAKALEIVAETGGQFIHPFDDVDVIAGQGTIGYEILKDLPTVDYVLIPAGGGGLLSGVAYYIKHINPRVKIFGIQAERADAICRSFKKKEIHETKTVHTIADGIAVKRPGTLTQRIINKYVDEMLTVSDDEIAATILTLMERNKQIVEPAGAAALAAVVNKRVDITGKKAACVMSGGNIDVGFIHRIIEKGLVTRGRRLKFRTLMLDVPGSLEHFSRILAEAGANIIMVQHDKLNADLDLNEAILHVICEVSGYAHSKTVVTCLEENGYKVIME